MNTSTIETTPLLAYLEKVGPITRNTVLYHQIGSSITKAHPVEVTALLNIQEALISEKKEHLFYTAVAKLDYVVVKEIDKDFRKALAMAFNCGGETVANKDPKPTGRKGGFDAILKADDKEDMASVAGVASFDDFTSSEKDALLFAFCKGWNAELD